MYFTKAVVVSLALFINKNSFAQPEHDTTDQNEVGKCLSDKKVCGTDGKTYNNLCVLQKETGVKLAHGGDCTSGKDGINKTAYDPDLILKSKIANTTEKQKKLVKHFNPVTGKWEYVVDILPTIVITPTFHHLQMANDNQAPSSYNITNTRTKASLETFGAVSTPNELDVNYTSSKYLGKYLSGMFPQGSFNANKNISEIVRNITKNFPTSKFKNTFYIPTKNETIPPFQKPLPRNHIGMLLHEKVRKLVDVVPKVSSLKSFNISKIKPPPKVHLKNESSGNHTNEVQPTGNLYQKTLPEKRITERNKSLELPKTVESVKVKNGSLGAPNNEMPKTLHRYATKTLKKTAYDVPPKLLTYDEILRKHKKKKGKTRGLVKAKKPHKSYKKQIKTNTNVRPPHALKPYALHENKQLLPLPKVYHLHQDTEREKSKHQVNNVFKPPDKYVSSPYPTRTDNVPHIALNISQSNNLRFTIRPKISKDHQQPVQNVSQLPGKETFQLISPVTDLAVNISHTIGNITVIKASKEANDQLVGNVSQSTGEGSVAATPSRNDSRGPAVNVSQPISNITEISKVMPSNGPNIHRFQHYVSPGHSKQPYSAVNRYKASNRHPLKNVASIIDNSEKNINQTNPNWGTYFIKLPGKVSDYVDLELKWEVLKPAVNQPDLTVNVSEVISRKNYTWPEDSKYPSDTSIYYKFKSGRLKRVNEKVLQTVKKVEWHNNSSKHPQYSVVTRRTSDTPIKVTKTGEIKTYQLEDEMSLKENLKSSLSPGWKETKVGTSRFVHPSLQVKSKKFGRNLEKKGSYVLNLPSNVGGNFKLTFSWKLKNKLSKSIRAPINVTEKLIKYDYKWNIGDNNKRGKPIGNENQPFKSVNSIRSNTAKPIKHYYGERRLTGRTGPGRRLHDVAHGLGSIHLDIPNSTTKPHLNTSASVKTEGIRSATNLYPGWYYIEMLFNVPSGGGNADSNNYINQNNYNDIKKSPMDPTDLLTFNRSILSLLPIHHHSVLNKHAIEHAKKLSSKCNCDNDTTK